MKNILIFFLSAYATIPSSQIYTNEKGDFVTDSSLTNETATKYLRWKLQQKNETISEIFAIVTPEAKKTSFPKFLEIFSKDKFAITPVELTEGTSLSDSFQAVNKIFDAITASQTLTDETTVHMDLTGGFRHSAMLLLTLLQMLHFTGYRVGLVTYTNFTTRKIEDAGELLSIYTLTNGTADFYSYGLANNLLEYFKHIECSDSLKVLLNNIQTFASNIKICSNINNMQTTIKNLRDAIDIYEHFLTLVPSKFLVPQEVSFNKLLPTIRNEYQELIKTADSPVNSLYLIKWCLKKGLLQQAVTFYTQLLPRYLFNSGILKITSTEKNAIIEECKILGSQWKSWELAFLKKYTPKCGKDPTTPEPSDKTTTNTEDELPWLEFMNILTSESDFKKLAKQKEHMPDSLAAFIQQAQDFAQANLSKEETRSSLTTLAEDNPIRLILQASMPPSSLWDSFIDVRINRCNSTEELLYSSLRNVPKSFYKTQFNYPSKTKTPIKQKKEKRSQIFQDMLNKKVIKISMQDNVFLRIIDHFSDIIIKIRNTFNHANAQNDQNIDIQKILTDDIDALLKFSPK